MKPLTQLNDLDTLTEEQEAERGELLAKHLKLRRDRICKDRYSTSSGTKTALGIFRTVKRLLLDGEDS